MKWMMAALWGIGWSSIFLGSRRTTVGQCRAIAHWLHASFSSTAILRGVVKAFSAMVVCCQTESASVGGALFKRRYIMLDFDYDYGLNISNELWFVLHWLTLCVTLLWRYRSLQGGLVFGVAEIQTPEIKDPENSRVPCRQMWSRSQNAKFLKTCW